MKRDLLNKWIEALESGEYKQGQSVLYDGERYCCLGVLAKIAGQKINPLWDEGLDEVFADEIGMHELGNSLKDDEVIRSLAELNDDNVSFKDIAKILRDEPEVYIRSIED